jgi:hypothetical protein
MIFSGSFLVCALSSLFIKERLELGNSPFLFFAAMEPYTPNQQKALYPRRSKLYNCAHASCPGLGISNDKEYFVCGVYLHNFCAAETVRIIQGNNSMVKEDKSLHFCVLLPFYSD